MSPGQPQQTVRERLALESGILEWPELARHFARGVVVTLAPGTDLITAAEHMVDNDAAQFQRWIDSGVLARASDDDARDWAKRGPSFDCVVVAPWVLVQERSGPDT